MPYVDPACQVLLRLSDTPDKGTCIVGAHGLRKKDSEAIDSPEEELICTLQTLVKEGRRTRKRKVQFATARRFVWEQPGRPAESDVKEKLQQIGNEQIPALSLYANDAALSDYLVITDLGEFKAPTNPLINPASRREKASKSASSKRKSVRSSQSSDDEGEVQDSKRGRASVQSAVRKTSLA